MQASKTQNVKANPGTGITPELKKASSFDKTEEDTVAESVADELVSQDEASKNKLKDCKGAMPSEEKKSRPQKIMEFHNIKISQVGSSSGPFDEVVTHHISSTLLK